MTLNGIFCNCVCLSLFMGIRLYIISFSYDFHMYERVLYHIIINTINLNDRMNLFLLYWCHWFMIQISIFRYKHDTRLAFKFLFFKASKFYIFFVFLFYVLYFFFFFINIHWEYLFIEHTDLKINLHPLLLEAQRRMFVAPNCDCENSVCAKHSTA